MSKLVGLVAVAVMWGCVVLYPEVAGGVFVLPDGVLRHVEDLALAHVLGLVGLPVVADEVEEELGDGLDVPPLFRGGALHAAHDGGHVDAQFRQRTRVLHSFRRRIFNCDNPRRSVSMHHKSTSNL